MQLRAFAHLTFFFSSLLVLVCFFIKYFFSSSFDLQYLFIVEIKLFRKHFDSFFFVRKPTLCGITPCSRYCTLSIFNNIHFSSYNTQKHYFKYIMTQISESPTKFCRSGTCCRGEESMPGRSRSEEPVSELFLFPRFMILKYYNIFV